MNEATVYLRHHSDIHLKELWKTTKNLTQVSRCPGRDSNLSPPEYKLEALPLEQIWSVYLILKDLFHDMGISRILRHLQDGWGWGRSQKMCLRSFTLKQCKATFLLITVWYSEQKQMV